MSLKQTAKRPTKKRKRAAWWSWGIIIVLSAGGYFFWQQQKDSEATPKQSGPKTITVSPSSYRITVSGPGTLDPIRKLDIISKVQGTITDIAQLGDKVKVGQVLVQIDPKPFERTVADAQLALEKAKTQVNGLSASQANTDSSLAEEIANAELTLQDVNRQVENARADLNLVQSLFEAGGESAKNVKEAQDTFNKALETQTSSGLNLNTLRGSQTFTSRTNTQDLQSASLAVQQAELTLENGGFCTNPPKGISQAKFASVKVL